MKHLNLFVITVFFFSLISWEVYGGESLKRPSGLTGDKSAILLIDQGIQLFTEHQSEAALSSFDMATKLDPTLSEAYFNAGIVALELGLREKGIAYLEAFSRQRPEEGRAFLLNNNIAATDVAGVADTIGSSGFWEFGLPAVFGSVFIFMMAAYLINSPLSGILSGRSGFFVLGFANGRVFPEKTTQMVYPLLKRARKVGDPIGLLSLMERRNSKHGKFSEPSVYSEDAILDYVECR